MKKTVIFVVESGGLCGGVRQIFEQAVRLHHRGWHVRIFSLDKKPAWFAFPPELEWRKFLDYNHLKTVLVAEDGLKIATWWNTALVVNECLRANEGCYLVADIEMSYYSRPAEKARVAATYDLPLRRYTEARWVEENLPGTTFVGIGIDLNLYRPMDIERDMTSLVSIARKQRLKGFRQLGELSRRLGPDYSLITVGAMPVQFGGAWKRHYRGLSDQELVRLYNQVGCLVSTSQHEGFGLPHIENMACGTPVVTTDADANMEFCVDGVNCLVFDKADMLGMAHGVRRVLSDGALRKTLIAGGFETAAQYPWDPVIDRLEQFLSIT